MADFQRFLNISNELVRNLSRNSIEHVFQDHEKDLRNLEGLLRAENLMDKSNVFITPEPERYSEILRGESVIGVGISRDVDILTWRTIGHRKDFPKSNVLGGAKRIFLDTVCYTGKTLSEVNNSFDLDEAVFEIKGKRAPDRFGDKEILSSTSVVDFDAVWHLDDFVQPIPIKGGGFMKPSEFLREVFPHLKFGDGYDFGIRGLAQDLNRFRIERNQTSPNLFLELARPWTDSFLGRSFTQDPVIVKEQASLIEEMEDMYSRIRR